MTSYLKPLSKNGRGQHGENIVKKSLMEGQAILKNVIENIEDTSDESTMLALATYQDAHTGVPVAEVSRMLKLIRTELLEADREFTKAAEALSKS